LWRSIALGVKLTVEPDAGEPSPFRALVEQLAGSQGKSGGASDHKDRASAGIRTSPLMLESAV
jgi:hypothetical protein